MINKEKNKSTGFTALELMVVVGIMVMLLVITLPNFSDFNTNQTVDTEADKLFSVLRQTQIWALTGQTVSGVHYNYGLHLVLCTSGSVCHYVLFNDIDNDKLYDAGEVVLNGDRVFLKGAYTGSIMPVINNTLDIVFSAPLGTIYFNGEPATDEAAIIIKGLNTSRHRIITVRGDSGQINVE
ncbi:MAG TPA: hypothetical protein PLH37_02920 [bacterium]|nr:hypothetical protein [bacterium]